MLRVSLSACRVRADGCRAVRVSGMEGGSNSFGSVDGSDPSSRKIPADVLSVFMCKSCNSVLGDGESVCGNNDSLKTIAFVRVTKHVKLNTTIEYGLSGGLEGCAYYLLTCDCCKTNIGLSLHSATRQHAYLLQLFCLFKDQILCYLFKTQEIVEGKDLHFDFSQYSLLLDKLQSDLCEANHRIEQLSAKRQNLQDSPESLNDDHS